MEKMAGGTGDKYSKTVYNYMPSFPPTGVEAERVFKMLDAFVTPPVVEIISTIAGPKSGERRKVVSLALDTRKNFKKGNVRLLNAE